MLTLHCFHFSILPIHHIAQFSKNPTNLTHMKAYRTLIKAGPFVGVYNQ